MTRAGRGRKTTTDRRLTAAAGLGFFVLGGILLRDAYEGSGHPQPIWLRPFSWW